MREGKLFKDTGDSDMVDLDLSAFDVLVQVAPSIMEPVAVDASIRSLDSLGLGENQKLVNRVSERAVDYARQRAAEMVGKTWVNGKLVDNPNARWRIDVSTRDDIKRIISDGLKENRGRDAIADEIEDSYSFSQQRANTIANFEIAEANSQATLDSYHEAKEAGVKVRKAWQADDDACEVCQANEDAGAIELDDVFPSGDDATPAHPNCECTIFPVVDESED